MARGGLYKSDIEKARNTLVAQGKHPSVDAVRVALGNTGSKTTIHRYLKELEAEEGAGGTRVAVSDAVQDLVQRLAAQLHQEADARIAQAQAEHDAALKARDDALTQARQEAAALSAQLHRTDLALAAEREAHAAAQRALQDGRVTTSQLEERNAGLTSRLAEQETHVASLEQKHQQARDALEHFRTAAKEQRDQEHRRHEHQVQGLQAELRQAQETLTTKNHELLQVNRDAARMTEQVTHLQKELRDAIAVGRQRQDQLDGFAPMRQELQTLQGRWEADAHTLETVRRELAEQRAELRVEREARTAAQACLAAAQAQVATWEGVFAKWEMPKPADAGTIP